ncbi:hypothetical protein ACFSOZ_10295 [Mesorhizobium newzealandense]|uniref:Uncharacterized protein n=1 Tax=Mesorhizobium newzealandense TaxID=1300302 RepID=A0ABW4UAE0_9HYPH
MLTWFSNFFENALVKGKAVIGHAHCEIGALDMRRADMHRIGIAFNPRLGRAGAGGGGDTSNFRARCLTWRASLFSVSPFLAPIMDSDTRLRLKQNGCNLTILAVVGLCLHRIEGCHMDPHFGGSGGSVERVDDGVVSLGRAAGQD